METLLHAPETTTQERGLSTMNSETMNTKTKEQLPNGAPVQDANQGISQDIDKDIDKESYLNWELEPKCEQWTTTQAHIWTSICNRYRVYRMVSISDPNHSSVQFSSQYLSTEGSWDLTQHTSMSTTSPVYVDTLEAAFVQVQKFHCQKHKIDESIMTTNALEVVSHAQKLGLDHGQVASTETMHNGNDRRKRRGARLPQQFTTKQKAPKMRTGIDEFGSKLGTDAAKINACLSTTQAKTMQEIMAECGLEHTRFNHVNALVRNGFARKVGSAYVKVDKTATQVPATQSDNQGENKDEEKAG